MTAKEKLLRRAASWTEDQAEAALRAVEGDDQGHAAERERELDRMIIDGYRRVPPGQVDEWGDLEAQIGELSTLTLQRLDQEEREAGHEPW